MQLITWSATIVAIRLLRPEDYGIVTIATLLSSYLMLLGEAGFGSAIVQKQVRDTKTLGAVFTVLLMTGLLLAGVVYLAAPLVGLYFNEPRAISVMRLAAVQFVLLPLSTVPDAFLRMDLRFKELGIANIAGAITSAVVLVALALLNAGPFALVGALLISQGVRVLALQLLARTPVMLTLQLTRLRGLLRFSTLIVIERSVWFWYTEFDNIIVARLLGSSTVGVFSVAKNVIQAPLDRISEVLNSVSFPAYSRIQQHGGVLSDAFLKSVRVGSYLVFPLFWGLGVVTEPLVEAAFSEKWSGAVLPMQLLAVAMPLKALQSMSTPLIHAIGRPDVSLKYTTVAALFMLPLLILGVVEFGVVGAAGSWAIGYPFLFALSVRLFSKSIGVRGLDVWKVLVKPILCATIMVATVAMVDFAVLGDAHPLLRLALGIPVGAGTYIAMLVLLDRKSFNELFGLVRSLANR